MKIDKGDVSGWNEKRMGHTIGVQRNVEAKGRKRIPKKAMAIFAKK
ncbi:hypothetical protein [Mechercharimyces sp. CAU 1602]|nr:hypothetical protein [Mechercharimyces sp. CAU 1602]